MEYTLEKAAHKDIPAMIKLQQSLADHHHGLHSYWLSGKKMKKGFAKYITKGVNRKGSLWLVAKVKNKTVGLFHAVIDERHGICEKRVGDIVDAFVLKEYRGYGIATSAIQLCFMWFKSQKVKIVELNVATLNTDALRVWKRLGFKEYMKIFKLTL